MDDNDKKLKFIEAMTKHGLQHFVGGGVATSQGSVGLDPNGSSPLVTTGHDDRTPNQVGAQITQSGPYGAIPGVNQGMGYLTDAFAGATHAVGDITKGIGSAFTVQNQYQAQNAPTDYTNYQGTIGQAGHNALAGYGQAQNIQGQQQGLANQLQSQSLGQGPNVAMNQLNQTTGQNIANQAALMASQRGVSQNPGMLARQAGMQGSAAQQQAAGQGATLRAQQQISAQQALGQQQAQMGQQNIAEQGVNASLFGGAASAQNAQNANNISNYGMSQGINAQIAQNNANAANKTTSGLIGGASSALAMLSKGGMAVDDHYRTLADIYHTPIHNMSDGGPIYSGPTTVGSISVPKLADGEGLTLPSMPKPGAKKENSTDTPKIDSSQSTKMAGPDVSSAGSALSGIMVAKFGGKVPGKAKVKDDSKKNDTVPAMLSAGEIVIPRHITMHKDAPEKAAAFVRAVLAKRGKK